MKKIFSVISPIIIMVVVAALCIGVYLIATNQIQLKSFQANISNTQNTIISNETDVILASTELPRLDASVIAQPLMTALVKDFTCDKDFPESSLNYSDTETAMQKLLRGEVDAVIAPYPSDDVISLAVASGIELESIPIAKEGFAFFTNNNNPLNSIKVSDIQKIYIGEVKNWSEIGGNDAEIIAFQRPENSINQREMKNSVMKGLQMIEPRKKVIYDEVYGEITDLIADYDNSENAIGYSYYTEANCLYDFDSKIDNNVKLLRVNDIELNYDTVKDNSYPLITNLYLIRDKNNEFEQLQIFIDTILSDRGKNAIKEAGYVDE